VELLIQNSTEETLLSIIDPSVNRGPLATGHADPETTVRVSPDSVTVTEGQSFQFSAQAFAASGDPIELDVEWRLSHQAVGAIDQSDLFSASTSIPQGHPRRATVVVGSLYGGRVYWDYATVRVSRD